MTNTPRYPLRDLIDREKDLQNGYGYDDFVRMLNIKPKPPSWTSMSRMFNRNVRTIIRWAERFEEEQK